MNSDNGMGHKELLYTDDGSVNWYNYFGKYFDTIL